MRYVFGYLPTEQPRWVYNSLLAVIGCFLVSNTWAQFFGYLLLMESILVTLEANWPARELPPED